MIVAKLQQELITLDQKCRTLVAICALQAKALGVVDKMLRTSRGCFCDCEDANFHTRGCSFLCQIIKEAKDVGMKNEADRKFGI